MGGVLIKPYKNMQKHTERKKCHEKIDTGIGTMCLQAKECHGYPANTRSQGRDKKRLSLEPSNGTLQQLDFVLLASRTVKEYISAALTCLVDSNFLLVALGN
jgi:hypothetical protein